MSVLCVLMDHREIDRTNEIYVSPAQKRGGEIRTERSLNRV